jgi:uncharacterized protein (DUF983 family)
MNWNRMLECKCPQCGNGRMFPYKTYNLRKFYKMEPRCPVCNRSFIPESGFYTGAMYFSYAINVILLLFSGLLATKFLDSSRLLWIILISMVPSLLLAPLTYRISRSLMLHLLGYTP